MGRGGSHERLAFGVDAIDIVFCHDVDVFTHGSREAADARIAEFMEGGYKALLRLRETPPPDAAGALAVAITHFQNADAHRIQQREARRV